MYTNDMIKAMMTHKSSIPNFFSRRRSATRQPTQHVAMLIKAIDTASVAQRSQQQAVLAVTAASRGGPLQ